METAYSNGKEREDHLRLSRKEITFSEVLNLVTKLRQKKKLFESITPYNCRSSCSVSCLYSLSRSLALSTAHLCIVYAAAQSFHIAAFNVY